jgi:murein tripeptide amidase MpaA
VYIKFTYPEGISHRYYPKISSDGNNWVDLDQEQIVSYPGSGENNDPDKADREAIIRINTGPDTLWIAANKMVSSADVESWLDSLSQNSFVTTENIGSSHQNNPIYAVRIDDSEAKKNIIVMARQYPSMSVGTLAMQSFINQIIQDTELANSFRSEYNVILFPHINPDGVDQGNWSHNMGGVNLTEDWGQQTMQPEIRAIKSHIESLASKDDNSFYLNIDIRSNRESILYVYNADSTNRMNALTMDIAEAVDEYLPEYTPSIKTRQSGDNYYIAEDYYYKKFGMESLVVIIDEDSTHDLIDKKGRALAESVMEHLMKL